MHKPMIIVTDENDPAAGEVVRDGLARFNHDATGISDTRPLSVVVRDPVTSQPQGGAIGRSSLGLLFLDLFYLPPEMRGAGLGSQILSAFEAEGRSRGCSAAVLFTISFQAPGFYERHGWRRFGEIACDPPGTSRVFMSKTL